MTFWVKCGDGKIQLAPYKGDKNRYEVVGCSRYMQSCIIPESFRGKPIVSIDSTAFDKSSIINEIFIPDSIKYIYKGALSKLPLLKRARVPLCVSSEMIKELFYDESIEVFYGTKGFEEEVDDGGGKVFIEDADEDEVTAGHRIHILMPHENIYKVNQNKWRFRLMQAFKIAAFFLLTVIAAIVPFDIFNARTGHYLNIVAKGSIGLGWTITLYVIYCIAALIIGISFTSEMLLKEKYIDRNTTRGTKPYNIASVIIATVGLAIISINLAFILPNIGKEKITLAGGNVNEIIYLGEDETVSLPTPIRDNDDHKTHYTKYTFKCWDIDGRYYNAGAEYNPTGWERAEAVFEVVDCATLSVSTSNAQIRVDYGTMTETLTDGEIEIPLGTEVTLLATYTYNNAKELDVNSKEVSNPYKFVMEAHTYAYAKSVSDGCFVEGTMVTLADGSTKAVEDLVVGDELLIFNHLTGKLDTAPMFINAHALQEPEEYEVISLTFSGGERLSIVDEHAVFDITDGKYAYINKYNANGLIGHAFAATNIDGVGETTLVDVKIERRLTRIYNPVSEVHVNLVAGSLLTNSACTVDMFEYADDMSYDKEAMQSDIAKYGLYDYDVFSDYIPYAAYEAFPLRYYKVATEKGLCTFEDVIVLITHYLNDTTVR